MKNLEKFLLSNSENNPIKEILELNDKEIDVLQKMTSIFAYEQKQSVYISEFLFYYMKNNFNIMEDNQEIVTDEVVFSYSDTILGLIKKGFLYFNRYEVEIEKIDDMTFLNTMITVNEEFFNIIKNWKIENESFSKKDKYNNYIDFLQDNFKLIKLLFRKSFIEKHSLNNSIFINKLNIEIDSIKKQIELRKKENDFKNPFLEMVKEYKLSEDSQILLLALLKEEYDNSGDNLRDEFVLFSLIGKKYSEVNIYKDFFSNLNEDYAPIMEESFDPIGGMIFKSYFLSEDMLNDLGYHQSANEQERELKVIEEIKKDNFFEIIDSEINIEDVVLEEGVKSVVSNLLNQLDENVIDKLYKWGIIKNKKETFNSRILFHGKPGTGKTMTAISLGKYLNKKVISFDCSKILSMYVGESEKNVRKIFDSYYEISNKLGGKPILLLNEADQFLSKRIQGNISGSDKMSNQMQNIFLEQIEKFEGILIATTNLIENLDTAFSRRFNYKLEFKLPNKYQRKEIWQKQLPKNADFEKDFNIDKFTEYELSGGQINLIVKNVSYKVAVRENSIFNNEDFIKEIENELSSQFNKKKLGF